MVVLISAHKISNIPKFFDGISRCNPKHLLFNTENVSLSQEKIFAILPSLSSPSIRNAFPLSAHFPLECCSQESWKHEGESKIVQSDNSIFGSAIPNWNLWQNTPRRVIVFGRWHGYIFQLGEVEQIKWFNYFIDFIIFDSLKICCFVVLICNNSFFI